MRPLCFRRGWQRQRRQPKSHLDLCISTTPYGPLLQTTSTTTLTIFWSFLIFARLQLEHKLPQPPPADDQPPPTVHTLVVTNGQLTSKQSEPSPHISNVDLRTPSPPMPSHTNPIWKFWQSAFFLFEIFNRKKHLALVVGSWWWCTFVTTLWSPPHLVDERIPTYPLPSNRNWIRNI